MEEINTSPIPVSSPVQVVQTPVSPVPLQGRKPLELSFPDAMREVMDGKKVTRLAWESNSIFGCLKDTFLMIFIRGEYHQWIVNDGDLTAIDWVVLPEQN